METSFFVPVAQGLPGSWGGIYGQFAILDPPGPDGYPGITDREQSCF